MKRQTARTTGIFLVLMMAFSLGACDSVKRAISGGKKAPDEFAVYKRPPLSLPPDYALRPPEPGREQLETYSPRDQARAAMLRRPVQAQPLAETTPGLTVLMDKMGAADADPAIRTAPPAGNPGAGQAGQRRQNARDQARDPQEGHSRILAGSPQNASIRLEIAVISTTISIMAIPVFPGPPSSGAPHPRPLTATRNRP